MSFGLLEMPMFFYRQWYKESVSPKLDLATKKAVAMRISDLTLESAIWVDSDNDFIKDFPELAPYSNSGKISGLQLVAVMGEIVKELQEAKAI